MQLLDPKHPFFAKIWVRWLCTVLAFGWACVEFYNGAPVWAFVFAAAGAYLAWVLLIRR
ncbi:hypothetical protein Q9295_00465 [Xinfangfangia sp. CPCC 101601]|uniref:DUF3329 domain-containing protein n=1 Tax=Pseudogemmobacter lacusdianii TaxID=3069608 RepID=A0ABU0VSY0_9RHOB|nr:hypothetical protein [Xinfangfangia sp. CPCC 101601]MDQ2064832.1 hypothetical protein [Xinfangfangia sp. CPCC 101601]